MTIFFWAIFLIIGSHYFVFPFIIFFLAFTIPKKINKKEIYPFVTLVIAAYNEEKIIKKKIENSFLFDYPSEKLEIVIISDGSTDNTHKIAKSYRDKGVKAIFKSERRGKTAALNRGVKDAKGEIIVFSDANSMYDTKSINLLVRNFADESVGGVCGRKSIVDNIDRESSKGDSLFWDFESILKTMQSLGGSISNGDGEIFAIRRELYHTIPEEVINDDQAITFNIIKKGYRVVYEPTAISYEEASIVLEDDFRVKARMVSGGYQTIALYRNVLFPPNSFFAIQFIFHKVLRYIMPVLLIILLITNMFILEGFYFYFFYLQLLFYFIALLGYVLRILGINKQIFYIPFYYCLMNFAALYGLFYFLSRKTGVSIWKKAAR